MDAETLVTQDMNVWSVDLEGDVFDDTSSLVDLDEVEQAAKAMASKAAEVLKAVAKLRRMVAIAKEA